MLGESGAVRDDNIAPPDSTPSVGNLDDADTNDTSVERFGHNIAQQLDQEFQTLPDLDMNFTPRRHNGTTATTAAIGIRGEPRIVKNSGEDKTCK